LHGCDFREDKHLSGDAILMKRAMLDRIGVLDMRFFGYFGDIDFGMGAHLAGFRLVSAGGAWLYHTGAGHLIRESVQRGEPDPGGAFQRRMTLVNTAYGRFREKWGGGLPAHYSDLRSMEFFPQAKAETGRNSLKCELPIALLGDVEFH
jgi:hypothetical protein